jgi:ABC-type antimicrobial peptide transport system permease subunit
VLAISSERIAVAGLHAGVTYAVRARVTEFGVRQALGATSIDNLRLVFRQGAVLCAVGIAIGALVALQASTVLGSVLFETSPTDAGAFIAPASVVSVVGMAAVAKPAIRAANVQPVAALRVE